MEKHEPENQAPRSTDPIDIADRTARRRALKALTALAEEATRLGAKLAIDAEIDADSAGRLLGTHMAEATANLGAIEAFRAVRDLASEGGNPDADS